MNAKCWLVYRAVNLINGKSYIGITGNPLGVRKSGHKQGAKDPKGRLFLRAIKKYGFDMFRFSVIKTVPSKEEVLAEEVRLIATLRPEYNSSAGGDVGGSTTPEGMKTIRDTLARLSEGRKKPVICLSDGKIFPSAAEAADAYGISRAMMCVVLKGKRATAKDMFFAFYTGTEVPLSDPHLALERVRLEQKSKMVALTPRRAVICKNDGLEYASVRDAASAYKVPESAVSMVVRGVNAHHRGRVFIYKDDTLEMGMVGKRVQAVRGANGYKKIKCDTDGRIYESAMAADEEYDLYRGAASRSATLGIPVKGDLRFVYLGALS